MTRTKPYQLIVGLAMAALIVAGLVVVPPGRQFEAMFGDGDLARILFFHVPCAMVSFLSFVVAAVQSARYLKTRDLHADVRASTGVELGLFFCGVALVTGAVFAKATWGVPWNWDPRETSVALLLLIYAAYLALRGAVPDPETRAAVSAVYALLSVVAGAFLFFVVPRLPSLQSLHPAVIGKRGAMDATYRTVFFSAMLIFTALYAWVYRLAVDVRELSDRLAQP